MSPASARQFLAVQLTALFLMSGVLRAQAPGTGAITGSVHDPAGLVVANASVSAVNESTDVTRTASTNSSGVFTMTLLLPGTYSVAVNDPGFAENTLHSVLVVTGETTSVEFRLAIKAVSVSLKVAAETEIVQAQNSTLGRAVLQEAMQALPLENRNYTQILSLSPGVVVALPNAAALGRGSQNVSDNGAKTTENSVQFNGVDANNLAQNSVENATEEVGVAVPAPDTIQEFKVQTGNYDAAYGRGVGANVDVVSKAGSNQFHGSVWEFLRNDVLNANDFFVKEAGGARPELKQNQFGGSVGGPIWRNRTFFFVAYQGLRSVNGFGSKSTAILPLLTADRSAATLGAQFCPAAPGRTSAPYITNAGGTQVACDGSNISPVALALLNFKFANGQYAIPSPQIDLAGSASAFPIGLSTYTPPASYQEDQYTADLDQNITTRNQASGRFFYSSEPTNMPFSPNAATVPGWPTLEQSDNAMLVLADTQVLSRAMVNIFRFGYMRFYGIASISNPINAASVGTETPTGTASQVTMPGIAISGQFTLGDAGTPEQAQETNTFIWQDTVSWTRGRHNLSMGAEAKRDQVMVNPPFSEDGLMQISTFDDFLLGESAAQNGSPQGVSNVTTSVGSSGFFRRDERYTDFASFVQDDIKWNARLTVNAGLRWEIFGPPSEIDGRLLTFDPTTASPAAPAGGTLSGFEVPDNLPGTLPAGVTRLGHDGMWATTHHDVSPRLGFACRLSDRPTLVLRGGYGIYFARLSSDMLEGTLGQPPFAVRQQLSGVANGPATLAAPFNPLLPQDSAYPLFQPRVPGGSLTVEAISPRLVDPYVEEYNLNLQYALGRDTLIETGYVGSRSLHLPGTQMFNQALLASPTNPVNGATTNTVANALQRAPFVGVGDTSLINDTRYLGDYNSLQTSVTRRMSHGLEFLGSYTWSKSLNENSGSNGAEFYDLWLYTNDQNNPRQAYGLSDFDRSNRGVLSLIYSTPTLHEGSWAAREALKDWQLSGILVVQSGTPLTILDQNAAKVYGTLAQEHRAQLSGARIATPGSLYTRVKSTYWSSAAFTAAPEAPFGGAATDTDFGDSGTGMVRGPGQHNVDLALERSFPLERGALRFRSEFFNVSNTPTFANPDRKFSDGSSFGTITSTANNPRIIQFALKYQF